MEHPHRPGYEIVKRLVGGARRHGRRPGARTGRVLGAGRLRAALDRLSRVRPGVVAQPQGEGGADLLAARAPPRACAELRLRPDATFADTPLTMVSMDSFPGPPNHVPPRPGPRLASASAGGGHAAAPSRRHRAHRPPHGRSRSWDRSARSAGSSATFPGPTARRASTSSWRRSAGVRFGGTRASRSTTSSTSAHAPAGSMADVQQAIAEVSSATGIVFDYDGLTDEIPQEDRARVSPAPIRRAVGARLDRLGDAGSDRHPVRARRRAFRRGRAAHSVLPTARRSS